MATGLLGINPYSSGVNLDLSSKVANIAIQQEQKNQAKREATEKYLMDYEKSLNPAGMRNIDAKLYSEKMAKNQENFIKNREQIMNPQKYGYEYQAQHLADLRDAKNLIAESKDQMKRDVQANNFIAQAHLAGKTLTDDTYTKLHNSTNRSIRDTEFHPFDVSDVGVLQQYDPKKHQEQIYGNLKMPVTTETVTTKPDYQQKIEKSGLPTEAEDKKMNTGIISVVEARGDAAYKDEVKQAIDTQLVDPNIQKQAAAEFKRIKGFDPKDPVDLRHGLYFMMAPQSYKQLGEEKTEEAKKRDAEALYQKHFGQSQSAINKRHDQTLGALTAKDDAAFVANKMKEWDTSMPVKNIPGYTMVNLPKEMRQEEKVEVSQGYGPKRKNISVDTKPLIIKSKDGQYYSVPQNVDKRKGIALDSYDFNNKTNITGTIHARAIKYLAPSKSQTAIARAMAGDGIENMNPE